MVVCKLPESDTICSNFRRIWHNLFYLAISRYARGVNMGIEYFPVRREVPWRINEEQRIEISLEKELGKFEQKISDYFQAPKLVIRSLDEMNSRLWVLMDGKNSLHRIVSLMDVQFAEKIAPASERITISIRDFVEMGLVAIVDSNLKVDWDTGPTAD